MKKLLICFCFCAELSFQASATTLWDIAQPMEYPRLMSNRLLGADANDPIFQFHTPDYGMQISMVYKFYSDNGCNSLMGQVPYPSCINPSHANKTYYITTQGLYAMATSYGLAPDSVACVLQTSTTDAGSTGGVVQCNSNTQQCISSQQPFPIQYIVSDDPC